jgi:hypothetical protein
MSQQPNALFQSLVETPLFRQERGYHVSVNRR